MASTATPHQTATSTAPTLSLECLHPTLHLEVVPGTRDEADWTDPSLDAIKHADCQDLTCVCHENVISESV